MMSDSDPYENDETENLAEGKAIKHKIQHLKTCNVLSRAKYMKKAFMNWNHTLINNGTTMLI